MPRPWPDLHRPIRNAYRRDAVRAIAIVLTVIALVLTSSALNWVTDARAADGDGPKKAVIVAGPVHSLTDKYLGYARAMANAAEAQGMDVRRVFHPRASKAAVKQQAQGADLFIYVGHGNGWPSAYGPFQEDTKNGLGLNPNDITKATTSNVVYKGANWLRENIELAPNAVVILSHLSYASGNASSGMPIPTRSVAVERVDNFANGFLSIGARIVWALGWQPGADVIDALHVEDATMDAIFMTRYRSGVNPLNGWIGHAPGYYDSERIPGARIHIDPDRTYGYLRAITGDPSFTTNEWRDAGDLPEDTTPPVISDVSAQQSPVTLATGDADLPIFTPNGDGYSDSIRLSHTLSENAYLEVEIQNKDLVPIRSFSQWAFAGDGHLAWDGRRDDGKYVGEGRFKLVITPVDRAGNRGEPARLPVRVLNSLVDPFVRPNLFDPTDGDDLAATATLGGTLTRDATVTAVIRDRFGNVVRLGIDHAEMTPGAVRFAWDGTDDAGQLLSQDRYYGRIRVTRPTGSYAHDVVLRLMPFRLKPSKWTLRRGETVKLTIFSAEPLKGRPTVTANQLGLDTYTVPVRKINNKTFTATLKTRRAGRAGVMKVKIVGWDTAGGRQGKVFDLRLR